MNWELDHVFFATEEPDAVERELAALGWRFELRREHHGQGTANACAFFKNGFFEILRARNTTELRSELVSPLGLEERIRWRSTGACPIGVCFRSPVGPAVSASSLAEPLRVPVPSWEYRPPYVGTGPGIPILTPRGRVDEPLVFLLALPRTSPIGHTPEWMRSQLTCVDIALPPSRQPLSRGMRWLAGQRTMRCSQGQAMSLELQFDSGRQGQYRRLASAPISLRL